MVNVEFSGAVVYALGGIRETGVPGGTLKQALEKLEEKFPVLSGTFIRDGRLSRLYFLYVNGVDVRFLEGLETPVVDGSKIRIMNALTGG